jgi:DNA-directed RNA polymerase sigma subunit (sigma70/sigma32)
MSEVMTMTAEHELPADVPPTSQTSTQSLAADADPMGDGTVAACTVERIDAMLSLLNADEQQVLRMLFGLTGDAPCTPEQIGAAMGLSPGQVESMHDDALTRLRRIQPEELRTSDN